MIENLEKGAAFRFNRLPKERRVEIARMGGRAKAARQRHRRALREAAEVFLAMPVRDEKLKETMTLCGVEEQDADYQMAIIVGMALKAVAGDTRAAKTLFDLVDETAGIRGEVRIVDDL